MANADLNCKAVDVVTYNMHGYKQGAAMLLELSLSFDELLCQEHWLISDQLHKLNNMSDEFRNFSVSAMDEFCGKGVLRGCPFGGLGIFVRKSVCNNIQCLIKSDRVVAVKVDNCIFVCVYFPVFGRPYYRSSLWYSVSSVVCRLSVCRRL